jgi:hypothetical protein
MRYNSAGELESLMLVDCDPKFGYHSRRITLSKSGGEFVAAEEEFLDRDPDPSLVSRPSAAYRATYLGVPEGFSRIKQNYPNDDVLLEFRYEGYDGARGFSAVTYSLHRDRSMRTAYFDESGQPARSPDGFRSETFFTGPDGEFVRRVRRGYDPKEHSGYTTVDETIEGKVAIERQYTHENDRGEVTPNEFGIARQIDSYDSHGRLTRQRCEDADGKLVNIRGGYAEIQVSRDDSGRATEVLHLDAQGRPVPAEVIITQVFAGGQGESLGLLVGDVLVTYDGKPVRSTTQFVEERQAEVDGSDPRELVVRRGEEILPPISVTPGMLNVRLEDRAVTATGVP